MVTRHLDSGMNHRGDLRATRFPFADERQLLRAALLDGPPALDAWHAFGVEHGGIDHLAGAAFALLPQLYCNLRDLDPDDPELGRLRGVYRRAWYANQMRLRAAAQAISALRAGGVRVLLTGRAALVALPIDDVGARPIDRIELLVTYRDRRQALVLLSKLGWRARTLSSIAGRLRAQIQVPLVRGTTERLSLHCSSGLVDARGAGLWEDAVSTSVAGVLTLAASPAAQLFRTCVPRRTPAALSWIPDAALILGCAATAIDSDRLRSCAQRHRSGAELDGSLRYLAAEFGLDLAPNRTRMVPTAVTTTDAPKSRLDVRRVESFRRLALDSALADLTPALAARGIRPLLVKGPAFASWLYDDPHQRPYGDIDLVVAPQSFAAAQDVLRERGFEPGWTGLRPSERAHHHERWIRRGVQPVAIELHHTLYMLQASPPLVWQRLTEASHVIEIGGVAVDVPSEPVSALIVGLHATQHGGAQPKPMRDLRRALERVELDTWRAAAALAEELGAGPAFAAGLRLESGGRHVCDRLGLTDRASRFVRLSAATAPPTAMGIERLIATKGASARLRLLAQELVPSRACMRASSPLARRGRVGLVRAYASRPFHLLRMLPPALRARSDAAAPVSPSSGGTKR